MMISEPLLIAVTSAPLLAILTLAAVFFMYNIDKIYGVPKEEISCPGCGQKYGHHKTKVDAISQECSACCKELKREKVELIDADEFIQKILGYGRL